MKHVVGLAFLSVVMMMPAHADEAPDHAVWTSEYKGLEIDLKGLGGDTVTLVHFWATWCGPCLEELPVLSKLGGAIPVVFVSEDKGGADDVQPFLARHSDLKMEKSVLDQSRRLARSLKITTLPTTVLVKNGVEFERLIGSSTWDKDDLRHLSDDVGNQ